MSLLFNMLSEVKWSEVAQSCPTLCYPTDCSLLHSSVYGIFQARVLEWVAIAFSDIPSSKCLTFWCFYMGNKGPSSQGYGFSSGHVWMWELDCEERWMPKNWCFWTVVLEKTLESPLDCKEIQPVHSKGGQSWVFFGRDDAKAETPVLWPPHAKSWLIGKDPDAGRDWGQEKKGLIEDEMAGWHHRLDGRESEWTPGDGDGQGDLACCNSSLSDWTKLNCQCICPASLTSVLLHGWYLPINSVFWFFILLYGL